MKHNECIENLRFSDKIDYKKDHLSIQLVVDMDYLILNTIRIIFFLTYSMTRNSNLLLFKEISLSHPFKDMLL